jgi:acetylornithine/succinyldiaminopimelate/putrescine aminotransferase
MWLGTYGRWFAFHQFAPIDDRKMLPDLIACAKPLGLGIPLGAVLLKEEVAAAIRPGEHGTTFGGGPLACRASLEYFKVLEEDKLLEHIRETGAYFLERLQENEGVSDRESSSGRGIDAGRRTERSRKRHRQGIVSPGIHHQLHT